MVLNSPYADLPAAAFWRSAMVEQQAEALEALYKPKFEMSQETAFMTAGSCFAQHLHRNLASNGWNVIQSESLADVVSPQVAEKFGYGVFSARYGNIYTARQLRELLCEAISVSPSAAIVWEKAGRYYDALRPGVEPEGLATQADVIRSREHHLAKVRETLQKTDVLIFTLGLTEAWIDVETGRTLPTAPGTIAGSFDPARFRFVNFTYSEVLDDLIETQKMLHQNGWEIKFLLTVSPVPLVATASGSHVGSASTYSKSVLRAVCGVLHQGNPDFDYFPSYEIITTAAVGGPYFGANMRDPSPMGVETVLTVFAHTHGIEDRDVPDVKPVQSRYAQAEDVQCEEMMLEAFARK